MQYLRQKISVTLLVLILLALYVFAVVYGASDATNTVRSTETKHSTQNDADLDPASAEDSDTSHPEQKSSVLEQPKQVTIAAAGDILLHTAVINSGKRNADGNGYDFTPNFAALTPILSRADLAICQMETPISLDGKNIDGGAELVFNAPKEVLHALKAAGYDSCSFASNHTLDQGLSGISATEQAIRAAGLHFAGASLQQSRAGAAEMIEVDGIRIGHLALTYTFPNSAAPTLQIPSEAPWLSAYSWPTQGAEGIIKQAARAKREGADFVVVSLHWGTEYQQAPTREQQELAQKLLASDAVDLILGAHAHVIQPCQQINGKHVLYGMGNAISNQSPQVVDWMKPSVQDGVVAEFTLTKNTDGKVTSTMQYYPTFVDLHGHVVHAVTPQTNPDSWARTVSAIDALGGCNATPMTQ